MITDKEFERAFKQEFKDVASNLIYEDDEGVIQAFDKYRLVPLHRGYEVYAHATYIGKFSSGKTALAWCIVDKNDFFEYARELKDADTKLASLNADISARAWVADRTKTLEHRENIVAKLETKIIRKKEAEAQIEKVIKYAKYIQTKGFTNETNRSGLPKANKTSR